MNVVYLMKYAAYNLHTFARQYTLEGVLVNEVCGRPDFTDLYLRSFDWENTLFQLSSSTWPVLAVDYNSLVYSAVRTPESIFIIGPIKVDSSTYLKYKLSDLEIDDDWLSSVPLCSLEELIDLSMLIYNLFHENTVDKNEIIYTNCVDDTVIIKVQKDFSNTLFNSNEYKKIHNSYEQEVREFSSIRDGDIELLKKSHTEDVGGELGILAKDPLRNAKNLSIVVITLASRAAIEGGVLPEISYSLSDSYISKIEELSNPGSILYLARQAEFQYAKMVNKIKNKRQSNEEKQISNPHVLRCKDYILKHLHEKLLIADIAEEIELNPNYLGELFYTHEGVSISQFILQEKVNRAKDLLIYSPYSYSEIAAYLGFSSQSHFGKSFKNITALTPMQYRQKYGYKEFTGDLKYRLE